MHEKTDVVSRSRDRSLIAGRLMGEGGGGYKMETIQHYTCYYQKAYFRFQMCFSLVIDIPSRFI